VLQMMERLAPTRQQLAHQQHLSQQQQQQQQPPKPNALSER
jgi:hypothetical protein